jgi:hypothetical protein
MEILPKQIAPDSLRGIGSLPSGLAPPAVPIAGKTREAIISAVGGRGFRIGRIWPTNAFVVRNEEDCSLYLFVRPQYSRYRWVATMRFGPIAADHDIDHVYARSFAARYGYAYVLVVLLPLRANRRHGIYEQQSRLMPLDGRGSAPDVCYLDERIFDKVLRRNPIVRRRLASGDYLHNPEDRIHYGLTLKQQGLWNLAFGFDHPPSEEFLGRLTPLDCKKE